LRCKMAIDLQGNPLPEFENRARQYGELRFIINDYMSCYIQGGIRIQPPGDITTDCPAINSDLALLVVSIGVPTEAGQRVVC